MILYVPLAENTTIAECRLHRAVITFLWRAKRDEAQRYNARAPAEKIRKEALFCVKQPAEVCFAALSPLNLAKFLAPTAYDQGTTDQWQ